MEPVAQGRGRWLPSLTHWLWLIIFVMLIAQPWRTLMVASDGDTLMHWRVGEWMLEHRQVVRADTFSYTHTGQPIVSKEWLAEVLFALAGKWHGLFGQACLAALLIATTFALLHRQLLRAGTGLFAATTLTLLAAFAANLHWLARPHAFSFPIALLWHAELRRPGNPRLPVLALLMVAWVNLHGAFLVGFAVLGIYWFGALLARDRAQLRSLTIAGVVAGLASLVNPNTYHVHLHNLGFLRSDFLTGWLAEYASTNFHSKESLGFLTWLVVLFVTLVWRRPRWSWGEGLMLVVWTYFALVAARNIPLLALFSAPLIAPAWAGIGPARLRAAFDRVQAMAAGSRGWLATGLAAAAIAGAMPKETPLPEKTWPVQALAFIQQHPEQFRGRMFSQYMWGGYLMWFAPEHKTFVDGRTDFYGEAGIRPFDQVTRLGPDWALPLAQHNVDWTLMPTDHRLNRALELMPAKWERVYTDSTATIFRRRS